MKHLFAGVLLFTSLGLPASASSIIEIDNLVTGPQGRSSIITLGGDAECAQTACVDATGGTEDLMTSSFAQMASIAAQANKKINFEFARRFPDPAVPVPSSPVEEASDDGSSLIIPAAPADSGTIAAQPPVEQQPEPALSVAPDGTTAPDGTRGSIDPSAPVMPVASSELREGE